MKSLLKLLFSSLTILFFICNSQAQKPFIDYDKAAAALTFRPWTYIDNLIQPDWSSEGKIWYKSRVGEQEKYYLYDPKSNEMKTVSSKSDLNLPEVKDNTPEWSGQGVFSPDKTKAVYIKDYNLWLKDFPSGRDIQLTTDGYLYYGYATDNAGWRQSKYPVVSWSPGSDRIATFRQDEREVGDMYLVTTQVGHPEFKSWKYPLPGDSVVAKIERIIIDVRDINNTRVIPLQIPPDFHRATLSDDIISSGTFDDNSWSTDGNLLVFVSTGRDHKMEKVRLADTRTGAVRELFQEVSPTQFESGQGTINWQFLSATNEIIWYSERSDWGHLYLYDVLTGRLKNQITQGNFTITRVLKTDVASRVIYFEGKGREPGNPYHAYLYRVDFNGKNFKLLSPGNGDHKINFSPDGKYFIDDYSQIGVAPLVEVRTCDNGKLLTTLAHSDISRLKEKGWESPTEFSVRSSQDKWDLYGIYTTPRDMDTDRKYPVIVLIYPGPQGGSVGGWSFSPQAHNNQRALAELGFVVVQLEGSCNPQRSKSFHDDCYGNMAENTLSDQISALQQLQKKLGFLDLDKVGIYGHSGGGFATAAAMLRHPEFFKVGIAESGNHDNRGYEDDWGERYIGLLSGDNYALQANQEYASNLKGKLLIAHGGMDDNVPPYNSYLLVDALIKANKDFDLIIFPNARHGYGADNMYMIRKRWDYFVENLLGADHPKEYKINFK